MTTGNAPRRPYTLTTAAGGSAVSLYGIKFRFLARSAETLGAYAHVEVTILPRSGPRPHMHPEVEESFHVLSGTLTLRIDGTTVHAVSGDYINIPRGAVHGWQNTGSEPAVIHTLVVPGGMDDYFAEVGTAMKDPRQPPPAPDPADLPRSAARGPAYGVYFVGDDPTPRTPTSHSQDAQHSGSRDESAAAEPLRPEAQ
jgi:quercetin dioxygenase-like cupin family protein